MSIPNQQACVWATRKELWDSFLNDPALADAIDSVRTDELDNSDASAGSENTDSARQQSAEGAAGNEQSIGARLRAYETPITDDILRQSIR